jgi:hypothetical protein
VTSINWAFNLALRLVPLPAFVNIKWNVYLIFGIFKEAMFIHVFFMFPETSSKTPEETENMFEDPNGPRYTGHWHGRLGMVAMRRCWSMSRWSGYGGEGGCEACRG